MAGLWHDRGNDGETAMFSTWPRRPGGHSVGLDQVKAQVDGAVRRAGRAPESVRLIAVSKEQPEDRVVAVLSAGQRVFGENRVQEAQGRWGPLQDRFGPQELHLIGPLQTNKARAAVELFGYIHTVDRLKLAETRARGASPALFVQVNIGAEPQKAGCAPDEVDNLVAAMRAMDLPPVGLMCIPPADADPTPHFARLAQFAAGNGLPRLSMGMSGDVETAIAHGATDVRVGSAIFGARH
jgi:PLP dependent protein